MAGRPGKLSQECIAEIRAWHAARSNLASAAEMRRRHGISSSLLSLICRGFIYKVRARG